MGWKNKRSIGLRVFLWYNNSANAEFKPAYAVLPLLRIGLYLATHGLKIKCPSGPLDFLRTWYNVQVSNEQCRSEVERGTAGYNAANVANADAMLARAATVSVLAAE